jgi:aryl-alcohol dehydrogenase-like predicted oxidoreductase
VGRFIRLHPPVPAGNRAKGCIMQYRKMGRTGLKVSALCLGTMTFGWSADEATSHRIMDVAVDHGINFFDTADIYSRWVEGNRGGESETIIGSWLKGRERHKLVLATKVRGIMWQGVNGQGLSRMHIIQAVEDSLRRLGTDYIDLYQTHAPDPETPLDETLRALDDLVHQGKVRYIGCSNYPAWLLMKSLWVSDAHDLARFDCIQPHYSMLHRDEYERELAAVCADQGVGVIPYSPLAAGFLTGKYTRDNLNPDTSRADSGLIRELTANPRAFDALDVVQRIASERGTNPSHVALAWLLAKPTITSPIIGARTVAQLEAVVGATDLTLSPIEVEQLDQATHGF